MRVVMTGGGTGGHIYPSIAIADKIMERTNESEILFIGTTHGMEGELVTKAGYPIKFITVRGLDRKHLLKNVKVLADYIKGKNEAKRILKEFKPDAVIGTGGYVSGPVVREAAELGIPCYIQEQNAFPGVTNKMLERYARYVFLGFEEAGAYFKHPEKHIVTGNPVRSAFFDVDREACRKALGLTKNDFMLLSFGGSLGAGQINRAMIDVASKYIGQKDMKVFFTTGKSYYEPVLTELEDREIDAAANVKILEYIDDMKTYLAAADLVISRSGALTVSEIAICGVPSILVPSPNVTGDHQTFNARAIADRGGAILLPESELSGERLCEEIDALTKSPDKLAEMASETKKAAPTEATDIIYYSIIT